MTSPSSRGASPSILQMAAPLIVFFILQRYFMQGIATVGMKG